MKNKLKRPIKPLYKGIIIISGMYLILAIYILLFLPELWNPIELINCCILIYVLVLAHHVPDKDAKQKMSKME